VHFHVHATGSEYCVVVLPVPWSAAGGLITRREPRAAFSGEVAVAVQAGVIPLSSR
jgi:hypothetical protein